MKFDPADTHDALLIQAKALAGQCAYLEKSIDVLTARVTELKEARETLESERAANEALTNEVDDLRKLTEQQTQIVNRLTRSLNDAHEANNTLRDRAWRAILYLKEFLEGSSVDDHESNEITRDKLLSIIQQDHFTDGDLADAILVNLKQSKQIRVEQEPAQ